jgi:NUMOD3 motif
MFGNLRGFNAPDNIVWLTLEQHAQVHQLLYELHGRKQDYVAWKTLSGHMNCEQAMQEMRRSQGFANKGLKRSAQFKEARRLEYTGKGNPFFGKHHRSSSKILIGNAQRGRKHDPITIAKYKSARQGSSNPFFGKTHSKEYIATKRVRVECPHCRKIGGILPMKRWHFDNCKFTVFQ